MDEYHTNVSIHGYYFQMAKRKIDCSLNDVIYGYLKKAKYEKTLKLFERKCSNKENINLCEDLINYVKRRVAEKLIEEDDLGFEINFGAYQSIAKVSPQHT